jgi:RNA polymerase sigma factor (sigma-70 family)
MNDRELLQDYVQNGSQNAFTQLVERHVNLVYSAGRRLVSDTHLAEDITQQVFMLLARKAGRLGSSTILSAWLYRAARHLASETVRRELRRRRREQIAVEAVSHSPAEDSWQQIETLLDEAMSKLGTGDHDAIVLRYFENRSLKEVGDALGYTEDAAQKRIARALERLRTDLARRGVTASGAVLATTITGGAVQSAPVGLAGSAFSASLAVSASVGTISHLVPVMTSTQMKFVVTEVIVAFSISTLLLYRENVSLRHKLADLRASIGKTAQVSADVRESIGPQIREDELQRLRKEHLEVLSLRGRVSRLASELRELKAAGTQDNAKREQALEEKEADSILFSAALTNRVGNGSTLVVGGWEGWGGWSNEGRRVYLLLTPQIKPVDSALSDEALVVKSQIVHAPENFWNEIGWQSYQSDKRRSTLAGVLTQEQLGTLLQLLKETKDAEITDGGSAEVQNGERMGLGFSVVDDRETGTLMGVDYCPRLNADGTSVNLELFPSAVNSETAIHSSLRQTP